MVEGPARKAEEKACAGDSKRHFWRFQIEMLDEELLQQIHSDLLPGDRLSDALKIADLIDGIHFVYF